jgi:hypothetical protein
VADEVHRAIESDQLDAELIGRALLTATAANPGDPVPRFGSCSSSRPPPAGRSP